MTNRKKVGKYASDLTRYINEECSPEMTVMDIDCLMYKASKKVLRVVESKHTNEGMSEAQKKALSILDEIFKVYSESPKCRYKVGVYTVRGNEPYDDVEVTKSSTGEKKIMDKAHFKNWCEFKE